MQKPFRSNFYNAVDLDNENFSIKIADFGFSKKIKTHDDLLKTICGTPLYMSPQIYHRKKYSLKSDVWSVGAILYTLMNGETPYESNTTEEFE